MALSPYIAKWRQFAGHDTLHLPGVVAHVRDDRGRVLHVLQRSEGHWGLPGGAVELGESPLEAVRREAREELGSDIIVQGVLAVVGGEPYQVTYSNGDVVEFVATIFDATLEGEITVDGDEIAEARWLSADDLRRVPLIGFARSLYEQYPALAPQ